MSKFWMVFDVESVGLHGEGFAVGWVVLRNSGQEEDNGLLSCPLRAAKGDRDGRRWVERNVPHIEVTHDCPASMRREFWETWRLWQARSAVLAADVPWPVEAKFLLQCIEDTGDIQNGPYPLYDIASFRFGCGFNPLGTFERQANELPAHHPLCDARQSARLLIEALASSASAASAPAG